MSLNNDNLDLTSETSFDMAMEDMEEESFEAMEEIDERVQARELMKDQLQSSVHSFTAAVTILEDARLRAQQLVAISDATIRDEHISIMASYDEGIKKLKDFAESALHDSVVQQSRRQEVEQKLDQLSAKLSESDRKSAADQSIIQAHLARIEQCDTPTMELIQESVSKEAKITTLETEIFTLKQSVQREKEYLRDERNARNVDRAGAQSAAADLKCVFGRLGCTLSDLQRFGEPLPYYPCRRAFDDLKEGLTILDRLASALPQLPDNSPPTDTNASS
jgi:chromosome segregation ATPase